MKKIISLILAVLMITGLSACSSNKNRILYSDVNLSDYVKLSKYKGIEVDTSSEDYKYYYNMVIDEDVKNSDLYVRKTEGKVADGDTVNIDYVGKKDGIAFEGGTANGYDLTIGSKSFIDGFEAGLIGKEIGDTVDLNLTFPSDYQNEELAGAKVVFTVKINYVRTEEARKPQDYYSDIGFKSYKEYEKDLKKRAAQNYIFSKIKKESKIKKYPEKDIETIYKASITTTEKNVQAQYGIDMATYLQYSGYTEESYKEYIITNQVKPTMDAQMIFYSILDKEGMKVIKKETEEKAQAAVELYDSEEITLDLVKEYFGEYYFEYSVVNEKVLDYLYKNAKIS